MYHKLCAVLCLVAAAVLLPPATAAAQGGLEVALVEWETQGAMVAFHIRFHNAGTQTTGTATGELFSQEYGAFLPDFGVIGTFDVPPILPDSFFDVFLDAPREELPPSAAENLPWLMPTGNKDYCGPDDHWDGNVDIIWFFNGLPGGQVNAHFGNLLVCPGFGHSYIHVVTMCPGWAGWWFAGVCAGWNVALVNEDLSPAPNPVPPGWSGHIAVSADATVAFGAVCCFALNFNCGGVVTPVNLCATACDCGAVADEPTSWGAIKSMYR